MHHFPTRGSPPLTTHPPSSLPCPATRKHAYPLHKTLPHLPFIYQIKSTHPGLAAKAFYRPAQIPLQPSLSQYSLIHSQLQLKSIIRLHSALHICLMLTSIFLQLFPLSGRHFPRLAKENNHQGNFLKKCLGSTSVILIPQDRIGLMRWWVVVFLTDLETKRSQPSQSSQHKNSQISPFPQNPSQKGAFL